ncbi:RHS repeat-associated core domain-containing protein [Frigidibacter sp. SD6-1]|uniref:RHS repeat-associated core domain-containing protein n=1 Tax=Frigidibacter sp. SD6-1 TaxID=3032581 RepID=UPI0032E7F8D0
MESGLHQNWMRDYDPTTGRYIQADPLGLVDGASVYGYAGQNPGRFIDPRGECFGPAAPLLPACIGLGWMLYDYLSDDCYTVGDFFYSLFSNFSPWKALRWATKAWNKAGGGGGGPGGAGGGNGFTDGPEARLRSRVLLAQQFGAELSPGSTGLTAIRRRIGIGHIQMRRFRLSGPSS